MFFPVAFPRLKLKSTVTKFPLNSSILAQSNIFESKQYRQKEIASSVDLSWVEIMSQEYNKLCKAYTFYRNHLCTDHYICHIFLLHSYFCYGYFSLWIYLLIYQPKSCLIESKCSNIFITTHNTTSRNWINIPLCEC